MGYGVRSFIIGIDLATTAAKLVANVYRQQIRVCVALIDAIKSVFIPNYHLLRIGVVLHSHIDIKSST